MQVPAKPWGYSVVFVSGIFFFAWCIGSTGYWQWLAIASLLLPSIALGLYVKRMGRPFSMIHARKKNATLILALLLSLTTAIFFGTSYRQHIGMEGWPMVFSSFAWVAVAIGAAEELIFRGALYYMVPSKHVWSAILITALAHAGYKTLLFLSPFAEQHVDTSAVFIYTAISGLLLGGLRACSASVAPPLLAHICWDAIVYADSAVAPWWVW